MIDHHKKDYKKPISNLAAFLWMAAAWIVFVTIFAIGAGVR